MNSFRRIIVLQSRNLWRNHAFNSNVRPLFSSTELGINSFILNKKIQQETIQNPHLYKARMKEICQLESETLVFSDDVFKMVYLAETDEDLDILHKILLKICSQDKIRIQDYNFGPEVMRLYHLMNKPIKALALMNDLVLYPEFQYSVNMFSMFLDLLFKNELYNEIIKMFNLLFDQKDGICKIYRINVIYFAACYKLNTKESYQLALKEWKLFLTEKKKVQPALRIRLFLAALALNQNELACAMEVLYNKKFDALTENIKCMVLAKSQRFNDVLEKIGEILNSDVADQFFIPLETVSYIEKEINKSKKKKLIEQFRVIKEELIKKNYTTIEPLDKFLCADLEFRSRQSKDQDKKSRKELIG